MTMLLFLIMVVSGGSAFADLLPMPPIQFPTPLHRIGIEIFAEVAGAIVFGGLVLKQMIAKYEKMKSANEQEVRNEQWSSGDGRTVSFGGEFVRDAKGVSTRWHELGSEERQQFESKLTDELQTFELAYAKSSVNWLRDPELPSQGSAKRDEWWRQKCQELVFSVLLQDDELRGRLKGVPIEWILSRMDKPTKRTLVEWVLWQMDRMFAELGRFPNDVLDFFAGMGSSEIRRCIQEHHGSGAVWYRLKMQDARKKVRRRMCRALFLVYLVGVIAMTLGFVGVEASCATARVFKIVTYPSLPVIGVIVVTFATWVAWKVVFPPLICWCQGAKLQRISERRGMLFNGYRGERKWRIPVPDTELSRQQMQQLPNDDVVGTVGGAKDASLRLAYPGVARHHAEIYFDKTYHALGGDGFVMRGLGRSWIGEYVEGRLPKKEKAVYLNVGREICVGPYAILKVVSVPSDEDNAFVFELVDGKRRLEND